jgi:hypothetical protein
MRRIAGLALMVGLATAGGARADETTFCNAKITTLPYTITVQGHYCFDRNLSTAITTGNAITINVDFVVLDLNNFKLGGGSAGLATQAKGIYALDRKNITVRNGNIRGFQYGIHLAGTSVTSAGHVVENNVLDANTSYGAYVSGDGVVVRNNLISATGGSTVVSAPSPSGIFTEDGFVTVEGNVVNNTFNTAGDAYGIYASGDVIDHNVVKGGIATGQAFGIANDANSVCRDNTVLAVTTAYTGCNFVGDNHP